MIPILFERTETAFTSNGLGRLVDAISCTVSETINGPYELELVYPMSGKMYGMITERMIIYATHESSEYPQPFEIYGRSAPMDGQVTFYARHISGRLSDVVVKPFEAENTGTDSIMLRIQNNTFNPHQFTLECHNIQPRQYFLLDHPASVKSVLGGEDGSLLSKFGGEFKFDHFKVEWYERRGTDRGVQIRYGKNLTDLSYEKDVSEQADAIIPYWKSSDGAQLVLMGPDSGTSTITVDGQTIQVPNRMLVRQGTTGERARALDLSQKYDEYPEQVDMYLDALEALEGSLLPTENLEVSFVDLWDTEEYKSLAISNRTYMGDTVKVFFEDLGINVSMRVCKTVYDTLNDRYDSIELGEPSTSFATEIAGTTQSMIESYSPSKSVMHDAIRHGTELLRGGLGGYVIINTNADGQPNEILIMDNPDKLRAVHVIRMNQSGIGFSATGYEGPFHSAWTIDGTFYADWITAGVLNADRIRAGVIQGTDSGNRSYWDLTNNVLHLELSNLSLFSDGVSTSFGAIASGAAATAVTNISQQDVFNKLTNNGSAQGIALVNGQLYINMSYLGSGAISIFNGEHIPDNRTFYANSATGEVIINCHSFRLQGMTIADIAANEASAAAGNVTFASISKTWKEVFNALTNNGAVQGLYIKNDGADSKIYLNATMIRSGILEVGRGSGNNYVETLYVDCNTGDVRINATTFKLGGNTIQSIANTEASGVFTGLTQSQIFNKMAGNADGIWLENGQIYFSFSYGYGGTLKLGGASNRNGLLQIHDSADRMRIKASNGGIEGYGLLGSSNTTYKSYLLYDLGMLCYNSDGKTTSRYHTQAKFWPPSGQESNPTTVLDYTGLSTKGSILANSSSTSSPGSLSYSGLAEGELKFIRGITNASGYADTERVWQVVRSSENVIERVRNTYTVKNEAAQNIMAYGRVMDNGEPVAFLTCYCQNTGFSDARAKENIRDAESVTGQVMSLRVREYDWKKEYGGRHVQAGLVAQEVEGAIPGLVAKDGNGFLGIDYDGLVPYLVSAIQEQQKTIDMLLDRVTKLEKAMEVKNG